MNNVSLCLALAAAAFLAGPASARLFGRGSNDALFGDSAILRGNAHGGEDQLYGGAGDDQLSGDVTDFLIDHARGGNDILLGGCGDDLLRGDAIGMSDRAQGGDDWVK